MPQQLKQNQTAHPLIFKLVLTTDRLTPATGKAASLVVTLSKNGGVPAAAVGPRSEIGGGYYQTAGNAADCDTLGPLLVLATATGSEGSAEHQIVAFDPDNPVDFTGSYAVVVHVTDGTSAINGARVTITDGVLAQPLTTNSGGNVGYSLNAGEYTLTIVKAGYSYTPTVGLLVGGNGTFEAVMTAIVIPPATGVGQVTGYVYCYDGQGAVAVGATIDFEYVGPVDTTTTGSSFLRMTFTGTSDVNGLIAEPFEQNSHYRCRRVDASGNGNWQPFTTPANSTTFQIGTMVPGKLTL